MSRALQKQLVDAAERRMAREVSRWHIRRGVLHARLAHRGSGWLVGAAFATGAIAALLPARAAVRSIRMLARAASFALRLPVGMLLTGRAIGAVARAADTGT
jgi:hypothetical protein